MSYILILILEPTFDLFTYELINNLFIDHFTTILKSPFTNTYL